MMSAGWIGLALALAGGMGLGALYFAGLWWTVRWLPEVGHPALLMMASLVTRLGGLLTGIWLLTDGEWQRAAAALVGILLARVVVVRVLGPSRMAERAA